MKAAVFHGPGDFRIEDLPDPVAEPGQVVLRVDYCGICGSDLHMAESELFPVPPEGVVMGHEFAGEIVEAGTDVDKAVVGQKVCVVPTLFCGECDYCTGGRMILCRNQTLTVGLGQAQGAYAEFVAVDQGMVVPLDGISTRDGALVEPLAVAHHGVDMSHIQPGQSALVVGCGPIGGLTIQVLKASGIETVIASEPSSYRRELASKLGATNVIDPINQDIAETARSAAGDLGVDVVFECTGLDIPFNQGLAALRPAGTLVLLGVGLAPVQLSPLMTVINEWTIKGALGYSDLFTSALDLLRSSAIDSEAIISAERPLEEVVRSFEELSAGADLCKVLISPGAGRLPHRPVC